MTGDAKKPRAQIFADLDALRRLVDQIPAMIWTTDTEFRLTSWTGGGLKALGLVPNQLVGRNIYEYFGTEDPEIPSSQRIRAHRRAIRGESVSYDVEFRDLHAQAHVDPLYDERQEIRGVIGVAVDVTARVRAAAAHLEAIRQLERALQDVQTLRRFLPTCAHCHRVQRPDGPWQALHDYVYEYTPTVLSHGICPDCLSSL